MEAQFSFSVFCAVALHCKSACTLWLLHLTFADHCTDGDMFLFTRTEFEWLWPPAAEAAEGVGFLRLRRLWRKKKVKKRTSKRSIEPKWRRKCDDLRRRAMKNSTPAIKLCIQNRCQTPKIPCGWDLDLNHRLFRGDFVIYFAFLNFLDGWQRRNFVVE